MTCNDETSTGVRQTYPVTFTYDGEFVYSDVRMLSSFQRYSVVAASGTLGTQVNPHPDGGSESYLRQYNRGPEQETRVHFNERTVMGFYQGDFNVLNLQTNEFESREIWCGSYL